jgi:hypothetical protein
MKLELKHLAGYLPYNLKGLIKNTSDTFVELSTYISNKEFKWTIDMFLGDSNVKPILRPLSDLTKEIEVNGEKFVPLVEICKISETVNKVLRINSKSNICGFDFINGIQEVLRFCYHFNTNHFQLTDEEGDNGCIIHQMEMFEKLLEWHFDIYGLIEKGLAIDINTLEK